MPRRLYADGPAFERDFGALLAAKTDIEADAQNVAASIITEVRTQGNEALLRLTERFDAVRLTAESLRVTQADIAAAHDACDPVDVEALRLARQRIEAFHQRQMPDDVDYTDEAGVRLGYRWRPMAEVGIYVPGGLAAYPSSVLMNAVPARVAGVERLVMTVPTPEGVLSPLVLVAADLTGVDEIYKVGGAQAIAALAYGTETIDPVDKIVGPGNAYVAAAKRQVFGVVGIDMIAGPSEILIVSDGSAEPSWIAADLLSQAEHDTAARAMLITDDAQFADAVARSVDNQLQELPKIEIAWDSWQHQGAIIVVPSLVAAVPLINRIAPEHLALVCDSAAALVGDVRHAGAIFIGPYSPEVVGDYVAGPSHVLPTGRTPRFSSGLGVLDFLKRSSIIACSREGLRALGPAATRLARAEGLDAHARSIEVRLDMGAGEP